MSDKDTTQANHTDLSELRAAISKVLVKWNMPTRQAAISEILVLFKQYAQPPVVADEEIDEILGDYGIGNALCILCKHDIYNHYWNGTHDWDACRVIGCKCIGKEIAREPNTVYECPLETEWVVNSDAKAALLQREQRLVAEARIDELKHAQKENRPAGGLHGPSHYAIDPDYAEKRLFQLRHNTNTGKEES